jgi:hypothetical protein
VSWRAAPVERRSAELLDAYLAQHRRLPELPTLRAAVALTPATDAIVAVPVDEQRLARQANAIRDAARLYAAEIPQLGDILAALCDSYDALLAKVWRREDMRAGETMNALQGAMLSADIDEGDISTCSFPVDPIDAARSHLTPERAARDGSRSPGSSHTCSPNLSKHISASSTAFRSSPSFARAASPSGFTSAASFRQGGNSATLLAALSSATADAEALRRRNELLTATTAQQAAVVELLEAETAALREAGDELRDKAQQSAVKVERAMQWVSRTANLQQTDFAELDEAMATARCSDLDAVTLFTVTKHWQKESDGLRRQLMRAHRVAAEKDAEIQRLTALVVAGN